MITSCNTKIILNYIFLFHISIVSRHLVKSFPFFPKYRMLSRCGTIVYIVTL